MDNQAASAVPFTQTKDGHKCGGHLVMDEGSKCNLTSGIKFSVRGSEPPFFVNTDEEFEPYDDGYACNTDEEYEPLHRSCSGHLDKDDGDSEGQSAGCGRSAAPLGRAKSWADYQSEEDDRDDHHDAGGAGVERGGAIGAGQPAPTPAGPTCPPGRFQSPPGQFFARRAGGQHLFPNSLAPEPGAPAPRAPARARLPPQVRPPPGSWTPREQPGVHPTQFAAASVRAQAGAPSDVRLIKAARPPAPLRHSKNAPVTSLTINHLPFQMRRSRLCALLDGVGFAGRYDYLYLPCNEDKTNRGHAFINMRSPADASEFFSACHGARVVGIGADAPVLSLSVSTAQGFEASIQRWTVAKMLSLKDPDFRPFIAGMSL